MSTSLENTPGQESENTQKLEFQKQQDIMQNFLDNDKDTFVLEEIKQFSYRDAKILDKYAQELEQNMISYYQGMGENKNKPMNFLYLTRFYINGEVIMATKERWNEFRDSILALINLDPYFPSPSLYAKAIRYQRIFLIVTDGNTPDTRPEDTYKKAIEAIYALGGVDAVINMLPAYKKVAEEIGTLDKERYPEFCKKAEGTDWESYILSQNKEDI